MVNSLCHDHADKLPCLPSMSLHAEVHHASLSLPLAAEGTRVGEWVDPACICIPYIPSATGSSEAHIRVAKEYQKCKPLCSQSPPQQVRYCHVYGRALSMMQCEVYSC